MKRYWVISPFHSKKRKIFEKVWEYDLKNGTVAIGWEELGDTTGMSESELKSKYIEVYGNLKMFNTFWKYWHDVSPGDIIIARQGMKKLIGIGTVERKAYYNEEKGRKRHANMTEVSHSNFIDVKWEEKKIDFDRIVFSRITTYEISEEKYNSLIKAKISEEERETATKKEIYEKEKEIEQKIIEIIKEYKNLKSRDINEANTKRIFIEPLLKSLGWNISDIDEVEAEAPVFGGSNVDYSLKINKKPEIYLECKALKKSIYDDKFISQAVTYAFKDGVIWCILTNGIDYRIYKSDEKRTMSDKLMFKFSLKQIIDDPKSKNAIINYLTLLSKESVINGILSKKAKAVFIDSKVKKVLEKLKKNPSTRFVNIIRDELKREYTSKEIKDSILRI